MMGVPGSISAGDDFGTQRACVLAECVHVRGCMGKHVG
jgi:hypothetical protein